MALVFLCLGLAAVAVPSIHVDRLRELKRFRSRVQAAEETGRQDLVLRESRKLRDLLVSYGCLDSALATCLRVANMTGISADRHVMADDWRVLSKVSQESGDHSGALAASKRAVLLLRGTPDHASVGNACLDLMDLLMDEGHEQEFRKQSEEALAAFSKVNDQLGVLRVQYRQGEQLAARGKGADALSVLHAALRHQNLIADPQETARIWFAIARANAALANWAAARSAFREAQKWVPSAWSTTPDLLGLLAAIQEGQGDLQAALHTRRQEILARDSMFNADRMIRSERRYLLFDARAKEEELKELHGQNNLASSALAAESTKRRWVSMGSAAVIVTLLLLIALQAVRLRRLRHTRLRNGVIGRQIRIVEQERTGLEAQNHHLEDALSQVHERNKQLASLQYPVDLGIRLLHLLSEVLERNDGSRDPAAAWAALRHRLGILSLVWENLKKSQWIGKINLPAHFNALAVNVFRESGHGEELDLTVEVAELDMEVETMVLVSLLFSELARISARHRTPEAGSREIRFGLRQISTAQCELLYTDPSGALSGASLGNGTLNGVLLHTWAAGLEGDIRLLKGETTSFQFTFRTLPLEEMRKAS
ncbi:MAG TPA: hypothetical protein PLZ25_08040 [Flavobacteriales bacterium]|nr:hypothetical protein [Flavobacteriales bacterium]